MLSRRASPVSFSGVLGACVGPARPRGWLEQRCSSRVFLIPGLAAPRLRVDQHVRQRTVTGPLGLGSRLSPSWSVDRSCSCLGVGSGLGSVVGCQHRLNERVGYKNKAIIQFLGYDVLAAAVSLFLELEVEEVGEFSLDGGGLEVSTGRDNLIVRAFETPAPGRRHRLPPEKRDPAGARAGFQRRGDRRRPLRRRPPLRAGALQGGDAGQGDRARGSPRQRRRGDLRWLRDLRSGGGRRGERRPLRPARAAWRASR